MKIIDLLIKRINKHFILDKYLVEHLLDEYGFDTIRNICTIQINIDIGSINLPHNKEQLAQVNEIKINNNIDYQIEFDKLKEQYSYIGELKSHDNNWGFESNEFIKYILDTDKINNILIEHLNELLQSNINEIDKFIKKFNAADFYALSEEGENNILKFDKSCDRLISYYENCNNLIFELNKNNKKLIKTKYNYRTLKNNEIICYSENDTNAYYTNIFDLAKNPKMIYVEHNNTLLNHENPNKFIFERYVRWKENITITKKEINDLINDFELYDIISLKTYYILYLVWCILYNKTFLSNSYMYMISNFHKINLNDINFSNMDELMNIVLNYNLNSDNSNDNRTIDSYIKSFIMEINLSNKKIKDYIISFNTDTNNYIVNNKTIKTSSKYGNISNIRSAHSSKIEPIE